ncbi:MAG TPA: hypothetical protein VGC55_02390 [Dokdonella sp.]
MNADRHHAIIAVIARKRESVRAQQAPADARSTGVVTLIISAGVVTLIDVIPAKAGIHGPWRTADGFPLSRE